MAKDRETIIKLLLNPRITNNYKQHLQFTINRFVCLVLTITTVIFTALNLPYNNRAVSSSTRNETDNVFKIKMVNGCSRYKNKCGLKCVDLKTSQSNCGKCLDVCAGSSRCTRGYCKGLN
jgi:hypothetical protein